MAVTSADISREPTHLKAFGPQVEPPYPGMVWVPGGTFLMGSSCFYPEERPVHHATIDELWMDRCPVTNEQFARFVKETGHVTVAERPPKAEDYPGAEPGLLVPGSLVFRRTKGPVDLSNWM